MTHHLQYVTPTIPHHEIHNFKSENKHKEVTKPVTTINSYRKYMYKVTFLRII